MSAEVFGAKWFYSNIRNSSQNTAFQSVIFWSLV